MVLESILNIKKKSGFLYMFLLSLILGSLSLWLSVWVFKTQASTIMVFFSVMSIMPFMYKSLQNEEHSDLHLEHESDMMKSHAKVILKYLGVFLGLVVALSFWFIVLPYNQTSNIFQVQSSTILSINQNISGNFHDPILALNKIFFNNLKVLTLCILFSFLYGAGAIFILSWNASVVSAAIGIFVRNGIAKTTATAGNYLSISSMALLRYMMIHGISEITAYIIGGLAGGIISVAVINHDFKSERFDKIILDSSELIVLAIVILFISAILEVYITPLFF